jgi:hypothetical protein
VLEEVAVCPCAMDQKHMILMLAQHKQADSVLSPGQAGVVPDLHNCVLKTTLQSFKADMSDAGRKRPTCLLQATAAHLQAPWQGSSQNHLSLPAHRPYT